MVLQNEGEDGIRRNTFTATIEKRYPPTTKTKLLIIGFKNSINFVHANIFTSTEETEKAEDMMIRWYDEEKEKAEDMIANAMLSSVLDT